MSVTLPRVPEILHVRSACRERLIAEHQRAEPFVRQERIAQTNRPPIAAGMRPAHEHAAVTAMKEPGVEAFLQQKGGRAVDRVPLADRAQVQLDPGTIESDRFLIRL